jgi:hypothetical protein
LVTSPSKERTTAVLTESKDNARPAVEGDKDVSKQLVISYRPNDKAALLLVMWVCSPINRSHLLHILISYTNYILPLAKCSVGQ